MACNVCDSYGRKGDKCHGVGSILEFVQLSYWERVSFSRLMKYVVRGGDVRNVEGRGCRSGLGSEFARRFRGGPERGRG